MGQRQIFTIPQHEHFECLFSFHPNNSLFIFEVLLYKLPPTHRAHVVFAEPCEYTIMSGDVLAVRHDGTLVAVLVINKELIRAYSAVYSQTFVNVWYLRALRKSLQFASELLGTLHDHFRGSMTIDVEER